MKHTPTRNLALTAITLLALTGCGAQATGSVPEPDSSTTTSAVASSTASPTEETAKAEETNYLGGSKAPEGEYRAADEHGPAQNVPKPVAPEGMNIESPEAMEKFIAYWQEMRNYAYQTGDTSEVKLLVDESHTKEHEFYKSLEEIYASGGWVVAGGLTIHYNKELIVSLGNGEYSVGSNFEAEDSVLWYDGKAIYNDNSDSISKGVDFRLKFQNGGWKVLSTKEIN